MNYIESGFPSKDLGWASGWKRPRPHVKKNTVTRCVFLSHVPSTGAFLLLGWPRDSLKALSHAALCEGHWTVTTDHEATGREDTHQVNVHTARLEATLSAREGFDRLKTAHISSGLLPFTFTFLSQTALLGLGTG